MFLSVTHAPAVVRAADLTGEQPTAKGMLDRALAGPPSCVLL